MCFFFEVLCPHDMPPVIHLLKVDNRNTATRCEVSSKLTIKTPGKFDKEIRHHSVDNQNLHHSACHHMVVT